MANFAQSLNFHQKALDIRLKLLSEDHPETARSYHNIGCCYYSLNEIEKALENYNKAYFLRKKILGEEHKDTIRSRSEIETLKRKINYKSNNNV